MPRGRKWTRGKIALMFHLRDVEKMSWKEIGERFGIRPANCCTRYNYYNSKRRVAEIRARVRAEAAEAATRPPAPPPPPPKPVQSKPVAAPPKAPPEPARRPRYFHDADTFVTGRIARQGITAGLLGDPPPGRSALDRRGQ